MRWPFGPPHLTLKPSKKDHKNKKKKLTKKKAKKETQKKTAKIPKNSFSVISQFFPFLGWFFKKIPFLHLGPKNLNPKNTIKIEVLGPFFLNSCCASRNGHFWTKKPKIYKFQLSFFLPYFLLFQQQKTQKSAETPIFIVFLLT